ncbi:MAG: bifunctional 4-hydroxy-2-oxoglutarate aldolase/2-dehydro-3-deoxy-phosphogluconate aldolase, partial [Acidimicrobiales bacterium]
FCLSPHLDPALVRACRARDLLPIPGVLSPTEIVSAQALGLDLLKLFPCAGVGPEYLKALRGPFPTIDFVPTGGIELDDVEGWLRAGAAAVGLGSGLVGRGTLSAGDATAVLVRRAETVLEAVRKAGDSSSPLATSS